MISDKYISNKRKSLARRLRWINLNPLKQWKGKLQSSWRNFQYIKHWYNLRSSEIGKKK